MLKLNTNDVEGGVNGTPVTANINGTHFSPGVAPKPIKPLPGQASLFSAGSFFDDDAEPMKVEPAAEAKPFVDDTPPFDVPPNPPELPPITTSEMPPEPIAILNTIATTGPAPMIVEVYREEAEYLYGQELQEMETELADLDLLVLAAKDELKKVSKEQQTAAKLLRGFKARGVEGYQQDLMEERQEAADEAAEAAAEAEAEENPKPSRAATSKDTAEEKPPFVPASTNEAAIYWQNVSVRELKINPKTITRLIESGIDTLEKLEWRRKGVYDGAEKWPTGIGTKKVDEIEAGIVQWFSENPTTDKSGAEVALPTDPVAVENDTTEPTAAAEPETEPAPKKTRKARKKKEQAEAEIYDADSSTAATPPAEDADLTEEEHEAAILQEMEYIRDNVIFADPPSDPDLSKRWDSGFECCQLGNPVTYCIILKSPERTAWIKGWLAADASMNS